MLLLGRKDIYLYPSIHTSYKNQNNVLVSFNENIMIWDKTKTLITKTVRFLAIPVLPFVCATFDAGEIKTLYINPIKPD